MNASHKITISVARAASIYKTMVGYRRIFAEDHEFFNMVDFWEWLVKDCDFMKIVVHNDPTGQDIKLKASVVSFNGEVRLVASKGLLEKARSGHMTYNFVLAHELAHLAAEHHRKSATTKHFKLGSGSHGNTIVSQDADELEAHYGAVFFQCGVALFNKAYSPLQLARLAHSEPKYVEKAQAAVRLSQFQRAIAEPQPSADGSIPINPPIAF